MRLKLGPPMQPFPVAEHRKHLRAVYGVQRLLGESISHARSGRFLASWARACYSDGVQAALCGLDSEASDLLNRAREWLQTAIAEQEVPEHHYFPLVHEANCHLKLALCHWLLDGSINSDHAATACDYLTKYFAGRPGKIEVAHNLPAFAIATRFKELIDHFHACKTLKPPRNLRGIKCPGRISFLIGRNVLEDDPNDDALHSALDSFFQYQIPVCLHVRDQGLGTYDDVPSWMLIQSQFFTSETTAGITALRNALSYVQTDT